MTFRMKENITVNVITAKGRTFIVDPHARHYSYPAEDYHIISSVILMSAFSLALFYCTNMSLAQLPATILIDILQPYFRQLNLQFVTIQLDGVSLPLMHHDIVQIGTRWNRLLYLDFRFPVTRDKVKDMPTMETVRALTAHCSMLEHLYLPDLNVQGFRKENSRLYSASLLCLTSSSLLSHGEEAMEVASALLCAFPNLEIVMIDGRSAHGWTAIREAIRDLPDDVTHNQHDNTSVWLLVTLITPPFTKDDLVGQVSVHIVIISGFLFSYETTRWCCFNHIACASLGLPTAS